MAIVVESMVAMVKWLSVMTISGGSTVTVLLICCKWMLLEMIHMPVL